MEQANDLRGEVDLELDGQSFVLRPSYEAVIACERQTGKSLIELAIAADNGTMGTEAAAIVVTECIRAWGRANADRAVAAVNAKRIGELLYDYGVMGVLPRVAIVLSRAASGGVTASGEPKASTTTAEILADALRASPPPPSDGDPPNSGAQPATSSGRRSKRGSK